MALALNGTDAIVMDESGSIHCVAESLFYRVADTAPEAIRILCTTNLGESEKILELD